MQSLKQIQQTLSQIKPELHRQFAVSSIGIFGSVVRGDARADSDIDLLVDFSRPVGIEFIDLADYLEQHLNCRVDLISRNGIKRAYLKAIEGDLVYV